MTRTVLITGVSGGIGSATAEAFTAAGWSVAGIDRVEPPPGLVEPFAMLDLGSADIGDDVARFLVGMAGLDALVNAAAVQSTETIEATPAADWDTVLATNARATFLAMQAARPLLRVSGGSVVNVASVHALATSVGAAPYAASKGAIVAMTRAAALEWAPEIRVNAVLPGAVDTQMLRQGVGRWAPAGGAEKAIGKLAARTPMGRVGRPDEIAQAILFLADGERSSFITGQTLVADGGALARLSTE